VRERNRSGEPVEIETSLWELAKTIREVCSSDDEAFAVLETMLAEGRISIAATAWPLAA
jgi:hypothetical protein